MGVWVPIGVLIVSCHFPITGIAISSGRAAYSKPWRADSGLGREIWPPEERQGNARRTPGERQKKGFLVGVSWRLLASAGGSLAHSTATTTPAPTVRPPSRIAKR